MRFVNEELLAKIKNLPLDKRQKVMEGLVRCLPSGPRGYLASIRY